MIGKLPPQNTGIEEAILGALMIERDALNEVIDIVHPNHFYKEGNRAVFEAILELYANNKPIDILTVTDTLKKAGKLELAGGAFNVTEMTSRVSSADNIEYHSRIIIEQSMKRDLIAMSSTVLKDSYDETTDVFDILSSVDKSVSDLTNTINPGSVRSAKNLYKSTIERIEAASKMPDGITGIPSGYSKLDKITAGWQDSDLIIIGARPSMGKTDLAINLSFNAALHGYKTALFSLEMSENQIMDRLMSINYEIDRGDIKRGKLQDYEWEKIVHINNKAFDNFLIADEPVLSTLGLRAKCRRLKAKEGIQLIVLDYLQLMKSDIHGSTNDKIGDISRTLKLVAKELGIPVIALSQLSRAVETRGGDKRPMLSDLRDSGSVEQDADIVMFPYRPIYYGITSREDGSSTQQLMELDVAKNRNGKVDTVDLKYLGKYGKIVDFNAPESYTQTPYRPDKFHTSGNDFDNYTPF